MLDALHQQQSTRLLKRFSERLDELILEVRRAGAGPLPAELADEIAATAGELMLALVDHRGAFAPADSTDAAMADVRRLREAARSHGLPPERLAEAVSAVTRDVDRIVREDKRAA